MKQSYFLFTPGSDGLQVQVFDSLLAIADGYDGEALPTPRADFDDPMEWDENDCVIIKGALIQPKAKTVIMSFVDEDEDED